MNNVKEDLIKRIVECLSRENEDREYHSKNKLDIPFIISPFQQSIDKFDTFIEDIRTHEYNINYFKPENYYSNGYIEIELEKNDNELNEDEKYMKENDEYSYFTTDYTYKINFEIDERYWNFCQCSEEDEDYDERYNCCGHGCDWYAPAYSIEKVTYLGGNSWKGDEHDYWNFKDKFYNIDTKEKEEQQKQAKKNMLEEEIKRLQKELDKLK